MSSRPLGANLRDLQVTNVSSHGLWLDDYKSFFCHMRIPLG